MPSDDNSDAGDGAKVLPLPPPKDLPTRTGIKRADPAPADADEPSSAIYRTLSGDRDEQREWITKVAKVEPKKQTGTGGACLVLLYPPGPDMGKRFTLSRSEVVLGRGADCDVQVDRDSVSRRHARVFRAGNDWTVEDLQSTNGSYVNDVPLTKAQLRDGDFVRIGSAIFKFLAGSGVEASYHEEIYRMTIVDALTGAHNKRYFYEFLERELVRCARHQRPLSLVMFDLDHFKPLNEAHGHMTGDQVLREIVHRVAERVKPEELLARYGGEEFAAVLPETDLNGARAFAEQVRAVVADKPFEYEGEVFPVTVSVGVASVEGADVEVAQFVKIADDNLFRAKREGRNRVVAGAEIWNRWKPDPAFRAHVSPKTAVVALSLLGRDQILAGAGGAARVDDLEGLLYSRLTEHQQPAQKLSFGVLEGGSKLLVGLAGRNSVNRLRALAFEALRRCTDERPESQFAISPVRLAVDGSKAIEEVVAALDDEIGLLENGRYIPQPIAVALRALDSLTTARAKFVLELGETLLQWLALCAAADLASANAGAKTLAVLARNLATNVTMGRWNDVLVTGVKEILDARVMHDTAWRACFGDKTARSEVYAVFNGLVELRNAFSHGATAMDEHVARKIIDDTAPRLRQMFRRELRPLLALVPAEVELVGFEGDLQSYRMTRLIGDGMPAAVPMYSRRRMNPGLWLCDATADRATALEPFFVRDTCPKCGARELFLLAGLDGLELRNPATGHALKKPASELPIPAESREVLQELIESMPKSPDRRR